MSETDGPNDDALRNQPTHQIPPGRTPDGAPPAGDPAAETQVSSRAAFQEGRPAAGQWLVERYEFLHQLGRGGMGLVWLAHDHELDNQVAIKLVPPEVAHDAGAQQQMREEAQAALALAHPNIVKLLHYHRKDTLMFLEMEFVKGPSLAKVLFDEGPVPEERLRGWLLDVCAGLEEAHRQRVVHRDIKPANLLLAPDGTVKITDFGIARVMADTTARLTGRGTTGTLPYMAPEQLRGKNCDARTDLYSLGITAYELVSGKLPFLQGDIQYQQLHEPPTPIPDDAPTLWPIIERLMNKDPADRYPDARALAAALRGEAAEGEREGRGLTLAAAAVAAVGVALVAFIFLRPDRPPEPDTSPAPVVAPTQPKREARPAPAQVDPVPLPARLASVPAAGLLRVAYEGIPPAAPAAAPAPELQFEIFARPQGSTGLVPVPDGGELRSMVDDYIFVVRTFAPGYLYIFQLGSHGNRFWLYPRNPHLNVSTGINPVKANTVLQLPGNAKTFYLDENAGVEHIYVVYSAAPWPALEAALAGETDSPVASGTALHLMLVSEPNLLRTRNVGRARQTPARTNVTVNLEEQTYTVALPSDPLVAAGAFLVLERWFQHVAAN